MIVSSNLNSKPHEVSLVSRPPLFFILQFCIIRTTQPVVEYYISITIVQNYTRKYHEFVAVCIVMSVQHE